MRVALVAGPDAGHAFPAFALAQRFIDSGDEAVVFTGMRWARAAAHAGIEMRELPGLDLPTGLADDAGTRLSVRAARMTSRLLPAMRDAAPDLVVGDVLTVGGGWAAAELGIAWVELLPHPLYQPSRGLPPIGSGRARGEGLRGHLTDAVMRAATATSIRQGEKQRRRARRDAGFAAQSPSPDGRLVATIPALEVYRPDWPPATHLIGALHWEPTDDHFILPPGDAPLVIVAPSTAHTGADSMSQLALRALAPDVLGFPVRVVISSLDEQFEALPNWAVNGHGRQDELLTHASVTVCGGGHGLLSKSLCAGVPVVTVPGGGDQWELACRSERGGVGRKVRPLTVESLAAAVRTVLSEDSYAAAAAAAAASSRYVVDPVPVCRRLAS